MNKFKMSRNPAVAFQQGKEQGRTQGVEDGIMAVSSLILLGMYNANLEFEYLTDEQFKAFFVESEKEVLRIFYEEYKNDPEDLAERAIYNVQQLRRKMGLEEL